MAGWGQLSSTLMMVLNILKIPPGVSVRKAEGPQANDAWVGQGIASHDFINTIVDITADDVCVGNSPVYFDGLDTIVSPVFKSKLEILQRELNKIAKWTAVDLLKSGVSAYRWKSLKRGKDGTLIPLLDELHFYVMEDGSVKAFGKDNEPFSDALIFLSYSKESMTKIDKNKNDKTIPSGAIITVMPQPIQLRHISTVARDLFTTERAMYYYRTQLSRIVRFASVDVGVSQGDKATEAINQVSTIINANSMSLPQAISTDAGYDDEIPIVPHRRGIGKPEMYESIPDFDISKMADLDYTLGRLFLAMRFPKSYSDFSQALSETAVSTLRGDIRYYKMCNVCRTLMEDTMNSWLQESVTPTTKSKITVKMATIPNSEDDDLIQTMQQVSQYISEVYNFIVTQSESRQQANGKLESLKIMLGGSAGFNYVQQWYDKMAEIIDDQFPEGDKEEATEEGEEHESTTSSSSESSEESVSDRELDEFEAPPIIEPESQSE